MLRKALLRQSQPATPSTPAIEAAMQQSKAGGKAPSIVSADMTIRGDLNGSGDLQIEGKVFGRISVDHLVITESGAVEGEIVAKAVRVSGQLIGTIQAGSVTLTPSARVQGDISHDILAIEAGAQLDGQCKRNSANPPNKLLAAPEKEKVKAEA